MRFLRVTRLLAVVLGFALALPGLLLLLASSQISMLIQDRDEAARDQALNLEVS